MLQDIKRKVQLNFKKAIRRIKHSRNQRGTENKRVPVTELQPIEPGNARASQIRTDNGRQGRHKLGQARVDNATANQARPPGQAKLASEASLFAAP